MKQPDILYLKCFILIYRSYEKSLDDLGDSIKGGKPVQGRENLIKLIMKQKQDEYTDIEYYRYARECELLNLNMSQIIFIVHL